MLEVIDHASDPVRMRAGKDAEIVSGNMVRLSTEDDNIVCVLSDDRHPFGMVMDTGLKYGFISVLVGTAIVCTDVYEDESKYKCGDLLYSNALGVLTNCKPTPNSILIGSVLKGPEEGKNYIEIGLI